MDSMTELELDETKSVSTPRVLRIAQGSGHYPHEVAELLEQFKLMQSTMQKTMKKNKKMGKGGMCAAPPPPPHRPAATRLSAATRRPYRPYRPCRPSPRPASALAEACWLLRAAQGLAQHGRGDGGADDAQDEPADARAPGRASGPRADDV